MLKVQEYLRNGGTLEQLNNDLGLKITRHESDPLVILNYSQTESPKTHEIVRECRALTLEVGSWDVIARSFTRFFNWGELADEGKSFNWDEFTSAEKVDGSLMLLYHYKGVWQVNTRGSFAQGEIAPETGKTWSEAFFETVPYGKVNGVCVPGLTYVFEYCSLLNKVVIKHPTPKAYLLSIFDNEMNEEIRGMASDHVAESLGCHRPKLYHFNSVDEIKKYIDEYTGELSEGFVVNDGDNRWKIKDKRYLAAHHMRGEGNALRRPSHLLPWVLANDGDELLLHYPEAQKTYNEVKVVVDNARDNLIELWEETKDIESQKEFAAAILPRTKFSSLLFQARSKGMHPKDLWLQSEGLILKVLYNK